MGGDGAGTNLVEPVADGRPSSPGWAMVGVWVVAAASAAGAIAADAHPVGTRAADRFLAAVTAALIVVLASRAGTAALLVGTGVTVAVGSPAQQAVGLVATLACLVLDHRDELRGFAAALVAAAVVQCVLRFPPTGSAWAGIVLASICVLPMCLSGARRAPERTRPWLVRGLVLVGAAAVIGLAVGALAMLQAQQTLSRAERAATAGIKAGQRGDVEEATRQLALAESRFGEAEQAVEGWMTRPAQLMPGAAQQVRAIRYVATTGGEAARVARTGAEAIDPERLRLTDGVFDLAAIEEYGVVLTELAEQVHALRERAQPGDAWLLPPVADGLDRFEADLARADRSAAVAARAARLAPSALGGDGPRRYFVAFVTPAEARASGGFMGNHAVLTIDRGRMELGPIGRTDALDQAGRPGTKRITGPPEYLARYGQFDPANTWANVTMSPDFPSVGQVIAELYPQSGGQPIDGVLRVDPAALGGLMLLTGPVTVPGLDGPLDADNVVPFLLRDQYERFDGYAQRVDILGEVGRATFDRLTTGPRATPQGFTTALGAAVEGGDLAMWMADPELQGLIHDIGADAAVGPPAGDSFGVITQNGSASKIDTFLQRTITYDADIDATTGRVRARSTVTLENTAPSTGLPSYVIGNGVDLPDGSSRLYVSVYSSLQPLSARLDGKPFELVVERELGRFVSSGFIDLAAGQERRLELDLAGGVDLSEGAYRFDVVPQVMALPDRFTWRAEIGGASIGRSRVRGAGRTAIAEVDEATASVIVDGPAGTWGTTLWLDRPG